jgi:hypothetical protein
MNIECDYFLLVISVVSVSRDVAGVTCIIVLLLVVAQFPLFPPSLSGYVFGFLVFSLMNVSSFFTGTLRILFVCLF